MCVPTEVHELRVWYDRDLAGPMWRSIKEDDLEIMRGTCSNVLIPEPFALAPTSHLLPPPNWTSFFFFVSSSAVPVLLCDPDHAQVPWSTTRSHRQCVGTPSQSRRICTYVHTSNQRAPQKDRHAAGSRGTSLQLAANAHVSCVCSPPSFGRVTEAKFIYDSGRVMVEQPPVRHVSRTVFFYFVRSKNAECPGSDGPGPGPCANLYLGGISKNQVRALLT